MSTFSQAFGLICSRTARAILTLALLAVALAGGHVSAAVPAEPWPAGEKLRYAVQWGAIKAAEGEFVATPVPAIPAAPGVLPVAPQWDFTLTLQSVGMVDTMYPMKSTFTSKVDRAPWRSVEYKEDRNEKGTSLTEKSVIVYDKWVGTRHRDAVGPHAAADDTFYFTQTSLDDVGSMLYRLRGGDWNVNDKRTVFVYESGKIREAEVTCIGKTKMKVGAWPEQPVLKLYAEPAGPVPPGKKKGKLWMWVSDDARRLPLKAELEFKYGTFDMILTAADPAPGVVAPVTAAPVHPASAPANAAPKPLPVTPTASQPSASAPVVPPTTPAASAEAMR